MKSNNSFLSISSEEEDSKDKDNFEHKKEFQNLFKGITAKQFNHKKEDKISINGENKEDKTKDYILKLREKLNNNTTKVKDKKLLILPPPENDLKDNHFHTKDNLDDLDEINENKGLANLINPDNFNIKKSNDLESNNNINNEKNIISINQKDILDSNWEIKYINKMIKKDMNEAKEKEENAENNKIKGKKRKRDKNKDELEYEENNKSKYSKISTKRKYGW